MGPSAREIVVTGASAGIARPAVREFTRRGAPLQSAYCALQLWFSRRRVLPPFASWKHGELVYRRPAGIADTPNSRR